MSNKILNIAAALGVFINMATAIPASISSIPEVIPGPGLPSLESLNLTSAELYAMGPLSISLARSTSSTAECDTYNTAAVEDVIACFNYLGKIGNQACVVSQDYVVFCMAGTAGIGGSDINGGQGTNAPCWDVALAVQGIFTNCNTDGWVGGTEAAYGNSNLNVTVDNIGWFA